jgi:hypothetical protein
MTQQVRSCCARNAQLPRAAQPRTPSTHTPKRTRAHLLARQAEPAALHRLAGLGHAAALLLLLPLLPAAAAAAARAAPAPAAAAHAAAAAAAARRRRRRRRCHRHAVSLVPPLPGRQLVRLRRPRRPRVVLLLLLLLQLAHHGRLVREAR